MCEWEKVILKRSTVAPRRGQSLHYWRNKSLFMKIATNCKVTLDFKGIGAEEPN